VAGCSNIATAMSFGLSASSYGASVSSFFHQKPLFFAVFREFGILEGSCGWSASAIEPNGGLCRQIAIFPAPAGARKRQENAKKC
jgi:hypothetical protein